MAAPSSNQSRSGPEKIGPKLFTGLAGLFLFLTVTKLGSPVILGHLLPPPTDFLSSIYESWPATWGYYLLIPLACVGLATGLWKPWKSPAPRWLLILPLVWLGWQCIAATQTVSGELTELTLEHFVACVGLYFLGCFCTGDTRRAWPIWTGLSLALCWIIHAAFEQHFGGLEATRKMLSSMQQNGVVSSAMLADPNYLKRLESNRVFATFSNPDALAGCIELILPLALMFLWQLTPKVRPALRWAFVVILGGCGLACLYWSGSKAGWLVALVMGLIALWRSTLSLRWKRGLIAGVLVLGLAGFGLRYAGYFHRQNNSVGARFAYWNAAVKIIKAHPVVGTGPGTFAKPYGELKRPEDEMTRLCHNDYLEQASDSGLIGFLAYFTWIAGVLTWLYRYRIGSKTVGFSVAFFLWLGVMGVCLHSSVEYHLYIPALAWPMFFLMGFLVKSPD